ncbi:helix-turn-helix domain-containing protein [Escherichia coli]|uniref:helix-turn-helix domain-containing protein n=1 Tax=Escherichia coli TaxID=562 RepID=UPI001F2A2B88|nr:helix-turn-helix domain-containing protein [Escherichia coli]
MTSRSRQAAYSYRGNQASFARLTGVQPAQVTQWINKGFIVVNHTLYSPRRKLGI